MLVECDENTPWVPLKVGTQRRKKFSSLASLRLCVNPALNSAGKFYA